MLVDAENVVSLSFTRHWFLSSPSAVLVHLMYCHTEKYRSLLLSTDNDCNDAAVLRFL